MLGHCPELNATILNSSNFNRKKFLTFVFQIILIHCFSSLKKNTPTLWNNVSKLFIFTKHLPETFYLPCLLFVFTAVFIFIAVWFESGSRRKRLFGYQRSVYIFIFDVICGGVNIFRCTISRTYVQNIYNRKTPRKMILYNSVKFKISIR